MLKAYLQTAFEYNAWANRRVWECILTLSEAQFQQPLEYSIGAIQRQCAHTLLVERYWMFYLRDGTIPAIPKVAELTSRDAIRALWDDTESAIRIYLDTVDEAALGQTIPVPFRTETSCKRYEGMMQVLHHSTDHRAQTLAMLFQLGAPTVAQDVIQFHFAQNREADHA